MARASERRAPPALDHHGDHGGVLAGGCAPSSQPQAAIPAVRSTPSSGVAGPSPGLPITGATVPASADPGPALVRGDPKALPGVLLIADRGNSRLIEIDGLGRIRWQFPNAQTRLAAPFSQPDDAFYSQDYKVIATNQEDEHTVMLVDRLTGQVTWQYGHPFRSGRGPGYLNGPDDAYLLPNGDVQVADIKNCRVIEINPSGHIVHQLGNGVCRHNPPHSLGSPNGDAPTADGGFLVTEINGSWVDRFDKAWHLVASVHTPARYPSDAQLLPDGTFLLTDWSGPGAVLRMDWSGHVLWRFAPTSGQYRLDHPSIALQLPNQNVVIADDWNHRILIVDPRTNAVVWEYGHHGVPGTGPGYLHFPDGLDFVPWSRVRALSAPRRGPN